jgi:hypothetical protein
MTPKYEHQDAIRSLKNAGVEPDENLDWIDSPDLHEQAALDHLLSAKRLRKRGVK